VGDRIVTWPNALSAARLAGVPVFLWLVLGPRTATADIFAAALLGLAGISDWLDGKLARMLNQTSRLGQLLDPAADRLYIAATIIALGVREIIPWWLFGTIAAREVCVALALLVLRQRTEYGSFQVSFIGKAATLCLMYAFPLLFLGDHGGDVSEAVRIIGWAFAVWGVALYWWAALLYLTQTRDLVKGAHPS
jgi:cardiolipin synthase (CMP-forming)